MAEKSPAFQWYPKDFDTDENVILMTLEEIGAYVKLMNSEWLHKGLPMEDEDLAIISRLGKKWFTGSGEKIKKCFKKKGKRLVHPRLEKERKKQAEWRLKSSNGGKKSASVRKESKKRATTLQPPLRENVNQSPTLLSSSSSSSSSPSPTSVKDIKTTTKAVVVAPDWIDKDTWKDFKEMRVKVKAPMTNRAMTGIINKLERLKNDGEDVEKILERSIECCWKGVFSLKDGSSSQSVEERAKQRV